jgi:hypothetical protein
MHEYLLRAVGAIVDMIPLGLRRFTEFHGTSTTQRWYHGYRGGGDAIKLGTLARRANNCIVKYFEVVCNQLSLLEPGEVPPRGVG